MRVLITGGAGFIGCNLADHFLKKGLDVVILDNLSRNGVEKNLKWLFSNYKDKLDFIKGDIRDFEVVKKAAREADFIIHAAAQVAVTTSLKNPIEDFEINTKGTLNILETARIFESPVIYFSTNKVYGDNVNKIPLIEKETRYEFADEKFKLGIPEDFPTDANEHTPYGVSKYAAELYTRDYNSVYGLPTVTFRCSCMYGARQFGNEDQGWLAHFVISSIFDRVLTIYGNGKQVRDILFIDDLTQLVKLAMDNINKIKGEVFNVGGGPENTISLIELILFLEKELGKKLQYVFSDWRQADQKVYISDIRKLERTVGWKPTIWPEEGIRRLLNWVKENIASF